MLSCNAARVLGRNVYLVKISILTRLGVRLTFRHSFVDVYIARLRIDGDARAIVKMQHIGIAFSQRLLELADQVELVDMLFLAKGHKCFHHL